MSVDWKPKHVGGSWWALVDGLIAGEVVPYGTATGPDLNTSATYWAAWVRRERLPSEFATEDEAKVAVEEAVAAAHAGS